jgi:SAM-dependent methyltransferase
MDDRIKSVPAHLGDSSFLAEFGRNYAHIPSAVMIRTAEAELIRALPLRSPALDLCCGDGLFASLVHGPGFEAGVDMDRSALRRAQTRGIYSTLACADISEAIPFAARCFNTILSNSSLEHVKGIDGSLAEIARVLRPGGKLYATFPSHFCYQWWPCGPHALDRYLAYQPVHNLFPLHEWESRMQRAGLRVVQHQYYLSKRATRALLFLDYHVSHVQMTSDSTVARLFVRSMRRVRPDVMARLWASVFARVEILAQMQGGALLVIAERTSA